MSLSDLSTAFNKMKVSYYSGTPNLGGQRLKLLAKDDAKNVFCIPVDRIASGDVAMPFRHPEFALAYYSSRNPTLSAKLEIICDFARIRNHRIMRKCNDVISKHENKKLFEFTSEMNDIDMSLPLLVDKAIKLGVNPYYYLNEDTDDDDVAQCTNSWCLNQNSEPGKASDNIIIITDLDNVDWLILIERQNGPGRSQAAWAGGFVDKNETFTETALREKNEEVDIKLSSANKVNYTTTITELPVIVSKDWDPRAKFVEGMENGAIVTHYVFSL